MAKDGVIFDGRNKDQRRTYGQLAKGQKIERHLQGKPTLKDVAKFTVVGKPVLRRDGRDKVTGNAQYAGDLRQPADAAWPSVTIEFVGAPAACHLRLG